MLEKPRAEFDVDAVGSVRKQIRPENPENSLKKPDAEQSNHQHIERTDTAMDHNLVDNHLKEQWRSQSKQLKKERRDQHLGQLVPVFVDGAQKPGDVETARKLGQIGAPGHQNEAAVPDGLEIAPGHQFRARRLGRLYHDLIVADLAQQEK